MTAKAKTKPKSVKPKEPEEYVKSIPSFRQTHLASTEDVERLRSLTAPHVDSFNYFWQHGLQLGIQDLEVAEFNILDPKSKETPEWSEVDRVEFWIQDVHLSQPSLDNSRKLYPRECRERRLHYAGQMSGTFCFRTIQRRNGLDIHGRTQTLPRRSFGNLPIMVGSVACYLNGLTPAELVRQREEDCEAGGYFCVAGIERCVRLLQVPRRNHATCIQRSSYKNRGRMYTDLGVAMRCARHNGDQTTVTNTLHYLTTGGVNLKFVARKQEFLIPAILIIRALSGGHGADAAAGIAGITDEEIYQRLVQGNKENTFLVARAGLLLQDARARFGHLNTPSECLAFIGTRFRRLSQKADTTTDEAIGHYILRRYVLIHLEHYKDKLECLLLLTRKLYAFAAGDCGVDNADSLQNQEILLPGHLFCSFVKEKFEETLGAVRLAVLTEMRKDFEGTTAKLQDTKFWGRMFDRYSGKSSGGIGRKVQHFLSTGNIVSSSGLDLMQVSGYTIVAERLNFLRYCAHFRSVHRGQFFMEMKTTAVRKLLPDQWGFLCPVHTPDGGPCGLLSHLSIKAMVMTHPSSTKEPGMVDMDALLLKLGVVPCGAGGAAQIHSTYTHLPVCIDGRVIGAADAVTLKMIVSHLRHLKVQDPPVISPTIEIGFIPPGNPGAPYPGLYLFTCSARIVRPVIQRATGQTENIGPLEQAYMDIACLDEDIREGITTHQELDPTNMLSLIANLTPFSDQNQSPRNMYQCQMGKQTMGTPAHSLPYRPDNKLYRIQTPQAPIVQTKTHGLYKMDEYPNGTNAVVAVLSYTGFDMEDSVILNKSSVERGFAHASVYKTIDVDLREEAKMVGATATGDEVRMKFSNKMKNGKVLYPTLEADGLPTTGQKITEGDPLYCVVDSVTENDRTVKQKEREVSYVQTVRQFASESGKPDENRASITLRFPRTPVLGDKFSSRHGQKGVLSILWPQEDMPFSESGISPDVIINPHAFPSRMTIGMLVESMAGKSGALHGNFQNATPFTFHESGDKVSVDYFGEQLQEAGYNYYGSEALYSGVSGCVMQADLYIGVVYYQRLRHMVLDKYQVRATGPRNELTRQPIKGRKKGGGIRLGEMERDSLLSHGTAFLLQDRLLNCSDRHVAYACSRCGDLLMATTERCAVQTTGQNATEIKSKPKLRMICRTKACRDVATSESGSDEAVEPIVLPYVYRYLANELAGMNVKMKLDIR